MLFREDVPLAPFTTFRIGGPARWFAEATSEEDLVEAVDFARRRDIPLFILGGGSNVLISDSGFPGLVLRIVMGGIEEQEDGPDHIFSAAAGEDWDTFVSLVVQRKCAGIECLAGIPGTIGGTPVQNVGAYGQEVATTIEQVRAYDIKKSTFVDLTSADCNYGYRSSLFNTSERGRYIVSRVDYRLSTNSRPTVTYADVKNYLKDRQEPTVETVARAVREIRDRKGMLIVPGNPDALSAGSFFKNPVIALAALKAIQQTTSEHAVPHYPAGEGEVKLPAAWLVERAGFHKGDQMGRVGISTRHTLALINRGGASASDVTALRDLIIEAVSQQFGITLEPEPVWVG